VPEPITKWQKIEKENEDDTENQNGVQKPIISILTLKKGNLLDMFYVDPNRWAYTFQSYAFLSRY
jgi:deoxycitidine kinase